MWNGRKEITHIIGIFNIVKVFQGQEKKKKKTVEKTKPTGHPDLREHKEGRKSAEVTRDNAMYITSASSCY